MRLHAGRPYQEVEISIPHPLNKIPFGHTIRKVFSLFFQGVPWRAMAVWFSRTLGIIFKEKSHETDLSAEQG